MPREAAEADSHATVKDQVVELYEDFEHEVEREVHSPHDSSQSDMLVGKHLYSDCASFVGGDRGDCDLFSPLTLFEFKLLQIQNRRASPSFSGCGRPWARWEARSLRLTEVLALTPNRWA